MPLLEEVRPDGVVADIITLAPALAGEMFGAPTATLIPHVDPRPADGFPPYSIGARLPRTPAGRELWRRTDRLIRGGLEQGREQLNETRRRLGLPPRPYVHNGISRDLALVATLPQLEYPRAAPYPNTHVTGPMLWEIPGEPGVEPAAGDAPVVLVAPSTSQDPDHRMLRAALEGLADEPVRVIATWNRRVPDPPLVVPDNATVVDWLSYAKTMPLCDVVVCHAGHGTVVRALASGAAVVCCPAAGDMWENAARVAWSGLGTRLPRRFVTPRGVRLAVGEALRSGRVRRIVAEVAAWCAANDGADRAAAIVERWLDGAAPGDGAATRAEAARP
jgi:UDP:flavonoid glycosyltransferase YjiC (YdhE family)